MILAYFQDFVFKDSKHLLSFI